MIRRYCDKCDAEIKSGYIAHVYEYGYAEYGFKNDLCMNCAIEVQKFINPRKADIMAEQIQETQGEA